MFEGAAELLGLLFQCIENMATAMTCWRKTRCIVDSGKKTTYFIKYESTDF